MHYYLLCIVLIVAVAVLMCGIVLIQNSKGGGLASSFASSNQIMGVRKTTDFLEKTTWTLAILIAVLSVAAAWVLPDMAKSSQSKIEEVAVEQSAENAASYPVVDLGATPETAE